MRELFLANGDAIFGTGNYNKLRTDVVTGRTHAADEAREQQREYEQSAASSPEQLAAQREASEKTGCGGTRSTPC